MATMPAGMSAIIVGTVNGDTPRGPPSASASTPFSIHSRPPMPAAMSTPMSSASAAMSGPLSCTASRAATRASWQQRLLRRASLRPIASAASKPLTSAAMRTGSALASKPSMTSMPLRPLRTACQVACRSLPTGLIAPMPVMTTRTRPLPSDMCLALCVAAQVGGRALREEAAVDVEHFAADGPRHVAEQEHDGVGDGPRVGGIPS